MLACWSSGQPGGGGAPAPGGPRFKAAPGRCGGAGGWGWRHRRMGMGRTEERRERLSERPDGPDRMGNRYIELLCWAFLGWFTCFLFQFFGSPWAAPAPAPAQFDSQMGTVSGSAQLLEVPIEPEYGRT